MFQLLCLWPNPWRLWLWHWNCITQRYLNLNLPVFETCQLFDVLMCFKTWCRTYHSVYCSHRIKCSGSFASLLGSSAASNLLGLHLYFNALFIHLSQLKADSSCSKQEYPEWVLFTSSGISSALYHACDVGTWCVLTYNVLQVGLVVICIIVLFSVTFYKMVSCFASVHGFLAFFHGSGWYLCVLIHSRWSSQEDYTHSCCHSHSSIGFN